MPVRCFRIFAVTMSIVVGGGAAKSNQPSDHRGKSIKFFADNVRCQGKKVQLWSPCTYSHRVGCKWEREWADRWREKNGRKTRWHTEHKWEIFHNNSDAIPTSESFKNLHKRQKKNGNKNKRQKRKKMRENNMLATRPSWFIVPCKENQPQQQQHRGRRLRRRYCKCQSKRNE